MAEAPLPPSPQQQQPELTRLGRGGGDVEVPPPPPARFADESFAAHLRYGSEYMDQNPITGKPGDFHLTSTGRMAATHHYQHQLQHQQQQPPLLLAPVAGGSAASAATGVPIGIGALRTAVSTSAAAAIAARAVGGTDGAGSAARDPSSAKSPRTPGGAPKPKRRKSKGAPTPMSTSGS